jgi:radical SAM protein with 4Fe4S-binding SPASM domain
MISFLNVSGRINFTGGDPLARPDIFELINYAAQKGIMVGILGNPEPLDYNTALKLKKLGVARYQISIDGLEETHDSLRSPGSFKRSLEGLRMLNRVGIPSVVMFTLSKLNAKDLIPVIRLMAKENVYLFDFARLVPIGRGKSLKDEMLEPLEYRNLLLQVLEECRKLQEVGCRTRFGRKENLWKLLYMELGLWRPSPHRDKKIIYDGCGVGINLLTILSDGTVYSCRRVPIPIGKVPDQSLLDIFLKSEKLNELRQEEKIEKCNQCELWQFCRGCRGVAYGAYGSYFASDPQCWKRI